MNPDSITPAIPKDETPQTELSAEDFQRSLFAWFEERGLLAELRAHLRVQMIGALRGSSPGLASRTVSPKAQAVNLLVAEYLMENEYLYALSVFSCEASLVMKRDEKQRRFEEKEMWEILETLGVLRGSEAGRRVASRYLSENGECLLCCLLRKQDSFVGCFELDKAKGCVEERPVKEKSIPNELNELLNQGGLNSSFKDSVLGKVRQIIDSESEKAFQEQKESFAKLESKLNEKVSYYQNEYMKKLEAITQMFEVEKKKLKDEHKIKHDQLENYSEFVQKKNQQIRNHFNEIINRDKALDEKEKKLFKLQKELEQREKRIKEEEKLSPTKAHEKIIDIQQLDNKPLLNPDPIVHNSMTIMTDYHEIMDSTQQTNDNIPKETEESVNALIHHMQMENERLRSVNADQMLRIQELSRRAAALCRELESGNGRLSPNRMFHGSPSLLLPSIGSVRNSRVAVNGAGEEGVRVLPTPPPRVFRNLGYREYRRKNYERSAPSEALEPTTSSDENTPTDEVLLETRNRLRLLEQESEEIDRNFHKFHTSRKEESSSRPKSPAAGNCTDTGRHSSFDMTDFFYNEDGLIPNRTWSNLKDIPITSKTKYDFKFDPDNTNCFEVPAFNFKLNTNVFNIERDNNTKKESTNEGGERKTTTDKSEQNREVYED